MCARERITAERIIEAPRLRSCWERRRLSRGQRKQGLFRGLPCQLTPAGDGACAEMDRVLMKPTSEHVFLEARPTDLKSIYYGQVQTIPGVLLAVRLYIDLFEEGFMVINKPNDSIPSGSGWTLFSTVPSLQSPECNANLRCMSVCIMIDLSQS